MHSLINELAGKLNLSPAEVEEALSGVLIRIRAGLDTVGEVAIEGLGTFRSSDGYVTFEPAARFLDEINKEFAGMKPVALTATGESVDPNDRRALPGVDPSVAGTAGEKIVSPDPPVAAESSAPPTGGTAEPESTADEEEDDLDGMSPFSSPPPPFPSKVRVPPSEKRSSRRERSRPEREGEFPDMGSVVSTRPVEPIVSGIPPRRRSKAPLVIAVGVVAVGLVSWLVLGGGDDEQTPDEPVAEVAQPDPPAQELSVESVVDAEITVPAESETEVEGVDGTDVEPEQAPVKEPEQTAFLEEQQAATVVEEPQEAAFAQEIEDAPPRQPVSDPEADEQQEMAPEIETAPAPPVEGPTYAWIVASYPSKAEAENRVDMMRESGYDAGVYEATVRGEPAFRVGIGHFESEAAAWRSQDMVPPEVPDAWITRVK